MLLMSTIYHGTSGWHSSQVLHKKCSSRRRLSTRLFSSQQSRLKECKNLLSVQDCLDLFATENNKNDNNDNSNSVVFVDASWYHKGDRNGRTDFEQGPRLPGARYMDVDDLSCQKKLFPHRNPKGLPHMLPPANLFALAMDEFKIENNDHVIIYGRNGSIFTPRTWFLFRAMSHDNVSLMQGSLEEWEASGGPLEYERTTVSTAAEILAKGGIPSYHAQEPHNCCVVSMNDMLQVVNEKQQAIIVDPRGSSFTSSGHIPGAIHVPYSTLVEKDNALKLKPKQDLLEIFENAGIDVNTDKRIIASCGSGVSVCHVLLALEECGRDPTSKPTCMYDGSWAEWGSDPDTPKVLL